MISVNRKYYRVVAGTTIATDDGDGDGDGDDICSSSKDGGVIITSDNSSISTSREENEIIGEEIGEDDMGGTLLMGPSLVPEMLMLG